MTVRMSALLSATGTRKGKNPRILAGLARELPVFAKLLGV